MSIDLTRVFNLDKNVFIEACAGAGKTWLLSKRYAAIIDDFARRHALNPEATKLDPSRILVITFTKKAQAEMAARIYEDVNELLNDRELKNTPSNFGNFLRKSTDSYKTHIRSTFSQNAISTIDSFCTQILRDHAEKMGLDPEFRIQDEADVQRIKIETWELFLNEQSNLQDKDLEILLDNLSVYHLEEYVKKLSAKVPNLHGWLERNSNMPPDALLEIFKKENPLPDTVTHVEAALRELAEMAPGRSSVVDTSNELYKTIEQLKLYLNDPDGDSYLYRLELLDVYKTLITTTSGAFKKVVRIDSGVWSDEDKSIIRDKIKSLLDIAALYFSEDDLLINMPNKWDVKSIPVMHHLAKFFLKYMKELNLRFSQEGVLSFNEVIEKTSELLKMHPSLAEQYGRRYSHILFDEFQDTDDLRWNIIRMIATDKTGSLRSKGLFIVGDTKQSIYRFKDADVQVMNRVRKEISSLGGIIETADVTYRSSDAYVSSIINPVVGKIFAGSAESKNLPLYDTFFNPTQVTDQTPLDARERSFSRAQLSVVLDEGKQKSHLADIYQTADSAEAWLKWLQESDLQPKKGPSVGILLRASTRILDYIRVFTSRGIDFEVVASKGLFQQQETFDLYHFLSVMVNPSDDLALVGVLRSPFFILEDKDIQLIRDVVADRDNPGWAWLGLKQIRPDLASRIRLWKKLSIHEPVDRILTKIIFEGERQLGWISETGGKLRAANIDRLIHLIHKLSLDGLSVREIQEYFKFQIQHGEAAQAEQPGSTPIQIMTMHKAKGLEFPVVILPEMQKKEQVERSGMFIGKRNHGTTIGIQVDNESGSYSSSAFLKLKQLAKLEEAAEDRRLFYVALTRAKFGVEFVYMVNPKKPVNTNNWWHKYLLKGFDLQWDPKSLILEYDKIQKEWQNLSTDKLIFSMINSSKLVQNSAIGNDRVKDLEIESVPEPGRVYREISPHTIMNWLTSSDSFDIRTNTYGADHGDDSIPRKFGTLLHRVLEMEWIDLDAHKAPIQQYMDELQIFDTDRQRVFEDLQDCVEIFVKSELHKKLNQIPLSDKLTEFPVFAYLENDLKTYRVNGVIDLLYHDGKSWVVLDYKSDQEIPQDLHRKEYSYWFQIQTYLWILKLMYGIDAKGALYFNRLDKVVDIEADEALYFERLNRIEPNLKPVILKRSELPTKLGELIAQDTKHTTILLEPTKTAADYSLQSLAASGLLHPRLQVTTLNEFRNQQEPAGRRLTPHIARMGVASIMPQNTTWGTINRIADAFYRGCKGDRVSNAYLDLFLTFQSWCEEHNIVLPKDDVDLLNLPRDIQIIVHSIHSTSPGDYNFLSDLSKKWSVYYINSSNDKVHSRFDMKIEDWVSSDPDFANSGKHSYTPCFSVFEEVSLHAHQIRKLLNSGVQQTGIAVAVSSMEKYVPVIKQLFGQHGFSLRINKREPVTERPIVQLVLTLLKGKLSRRISWDALMSVWLHPLLIPSGNKGEERMLLDVLVRKAGLYHYDMEAIHNLKLKHLSDTISELHEFVTNVLMVESSGGVIRQVELILAFIDQYVFKERLESGSVSAKSLKSLETTLKAIQHDWQSFMSPKGGVADLHRELRERLNGVEVVSSSQGYGIDVVSYLDTLNLENEYLFILGMNEGEFPLSIKMNPYLAESVFNPWFMNVHLFERWLRRDTGRLFMTAPLKDLDGNSLQISTFCQYLAKAEYPDNPPYSSAERLSALAGNLITDPRSDYQRRHNYLLRRSNDHEWSGKLKASSEKSIYEISASAMDDLLKCPQKYWYGRILELKTLETDISRRDETWVGNLVHEVLELFGRSGGFELAAKDLASAYKEYELAAKSILAKHEDMIGRGLLNKKWMALYFSNYMDSDKNLIAAMLKLESQYLNEYDEKYFEKSFGYKDEESWPEVVIDNENIKLHIKGKIDRVFIKKDQIWATDYKTGNIDLSETRDFWTSQMLYYFLAIKMRYQNAEVMLTYQQLKSFKSKYYGFKGFIGDTAGDYAVLAGATKRNTIQIADESDWSVERIKNETLKYAQYLVRNSYPLTEREEEIACKYCDFERVCRRHSMPR